MRFTLVLILGIMLVGCTSVMKYDAKMALMLNQMDKNMSTNCRAGFAHGITAASNKDAQLIMALSSLLRYADINDEDFKDCYSKGAYITFAAHGAGDIVAKFVKDIINTVPAAACPIK
jgi:hypothetical protein